MPEQIPGIDEIETLVINDGSTDATVQVAREQGVDHILDLGINKGLANAWSRGLEACLAAGADIIVNTDGDNQYCGQDIPKLVRPIIDKEAEIVVGARPIEDIGHFSWLKKRLQHLGSWVVSRCAGVQLKDAASGFRAYSAGAARDMNLLSDYSHCTETLIRAARRGLQVKNVSIRVNKRLRSVVDPLVGLAHPVPKIAILPLIMAFLGIGNTSKVVVIGLAAFFPVLINSMHGVRQINRAHFEVARNFKASPLKVLWRVILPGSLPMVLTGTRLGFNSALVVTVAVELVYARQGLGAMVWRAWETMRVEELYAGILVTGLIGITFNAFLGFLMRLLVPCRSEAEV